MQGFGLSGHTVGSHDTRAAAFNARARRTAAVQARAPRALAIHPVARPCAQDLADAPPSAPSPPPDNTGEQVAVILQRLAQKGAEQANISLASQFCHGRHGCRRRPLCILVLCSKVSRLRCRCCMGWFEGRVHKLSHRTTHRQTSSKLASSGVFARLSETILYSLRRSRGDWAKYAAHSPSSICGPAPCDFTLMVCALRGHYQAQLAGQLHANLMPCCMLPITS